MSVRLVDIAKATGFSLMTVSLVLNPRKGECRISKKTQEKIKKVAKEMNYTPNMTARILSGAKSNVVGVMFCADNDYFYADLQLRIDDALRSRGYTGFYTFWKSLDEFDRSLSAMKQFNVCGILTGHDLDVKFPDVPVICYGFLHQKFESVYPSQQEMMHCAVEYALKQGYTKIGFVGRIELKSRVAAFNDEVTSLGGTVSFCKLFARNESPQEGVDEFLKQNTDTEVLIFGNDQVAMEWMAELQSRNIRIPQDIKVIGVNNVNYCTNVTPRLTSVDFSLSSLGDLLVDRLIKHIEEPDSIRENIKLPITIVERDSCPAKSK